MAMSVRMARSASAGARPERRASPARSKGVVRSQLRYPGVSGVASYTHGPSRLGGRGG
jgi:hypothetical protein